MARKSAASAQQGLRKVVKSSVTYHPPALKALATIQQSGTMQAKQDIINALLVRHARLVELQRDAEDAGGHLRLVYVTPKGNTETLEDRCQFNV